MSPIDQVIHKVRQYILLFSLFPLLLLVLWKPDITLVLAEEVSDAAEQATMTVGDLLEGLQALYETDWDEMLEMLDEMPSIREMTTPSWPELEGEPVEWPVELKGQPLLDRILEIPEWSLLKQCGNWYYEQFLNAMGRRYPGLERFLAGEDAMELLLQNHKRDQDVTEFLLLAHQMRTEEYGLLGKIRLAWACGLKGLYAKFCSTRGEYSYYIVYTPFLLILLVWLYRKVPVYKKPEYTEKNPRALPAQKSLALPEPDPEHHELVALPPVRLQERRICISCAYLAMLRFRKKPLLALPPHVEEGNCESIEDSCIDTGRDIVSGGVNHSDHPDRRSG